MDGIRWVEKKKNNCARMYLFIFSRNSVAIYDVDSRHRETDIPECLSLKMFLQNKVQYPQTSVKNREIECSMCRYTRHNRPKIMIGTTLK
jgi:hypothetical protein